jgi:hypothetical protein
MAKYMTNSNPVVHRVTEVEELPFEVSAIKKQSPMQKMKSPTKGEKENFTIMKSPSKIFVTNGGGSTYFQNRRVKKQPSANKKGPNSKYQ